MRLINIEMFIYDLLETVSIDTSDNLYKMITELEECIQTSIYDYAEDNNIEIDL